MYRELPPHPALQPFVDRFWVSTARTTVPRRILPDGCIDVIIDLARGDGASAVGLGAGRRPGPGPRLALADAALRLGYFDQAHMTADFRSLAGITPAETLAATESTGDPATGSIFSIQSLFGGA